MFDNSIISTTDISNYVAPTEKYSFFIKDLIVNILSIADISFEKVSEIINLTKGIYIPPERICEIYHDNVRWKIYDDFEKIQEDIRNGKIQLSGVIHYDEQFLWVKHQPYVRLTIYLMPDKSSTSRYCNTSL